MQLNVDLNSLLHQLYSRRSKIELEADSSSKRPEQLLEPQSLFLDYLQRHSFTSTSGSLYLQQLQRREVREQTGQEEQKRAPSHLQLTESHFVPSSNAGRKKPRKPRTIFTARQLLELERRFENQKYLTSTERSCLAFILGLSDEQIKVWFQNRRSKWKRGSGRTERHQSDGRQKGSQPTSALTQLDQPTPHLQHSSQPHLDSLPLLNPFLLPFLNICDSYYK